MNEKNLELQVEILNAKCEAAFNLLQAVATGQPVKDRLVLADVAELTAKANTELKMATTISDEALEEGARIYRSFAATLR